VVSSEVSMYRALLLTAMLLAAEPGFSADLSYTYDALGRVVRVDYPSGNSVLYTYDAAGNRMAVSTAVAPLPPAAVPDSATSPYQTPVSFDPRLNDSDPNGYSLTVISVGAAGNGAVVITGGGAGVTYTPAPGFSGTDRFYYTISNGHSGQATALDTITINAPPSPPVANPYSATTNYNTAVTFDPRVNDTGTGITITSVGAPLHGTAVVNSGTSVTYTPTSGYSGTDGFSYIIADFLSRTASSTASVTISAPPPPLAPDVTEEYPNPPRAHTFYPVLQPGSSITSLTSPSNGTAAIVGSGTGITYTASAGFSGSDYFTYTVTDSSGNTGTGNVYLTIDGP
jgi:YD repeat-containing protein